MAAEGWDVLLLDVNPPEGPIGDQRFIAGDVRDAAAVRAAAEGCDVVVNNAALVPVTRSTLETYRAVNVGGTKNALAAAREVGAYVVHISSTSLYGVPRDVPITPATPFAPFEDYGVSKTEAEAVVDRTRDDGLVVSSLRPRTLLGRGRLGLFDVIFPRVRAGKAVPVFGRGDNLLQLLDADDLASAVLCAIRTKANAGYNVGAERFSTVRADMEALITHAGTGARVVGVPVAAIHAVLRPLDAIGRSPFTPWHYRTAHVPFYCDIADTKADLGWTPRRSNAEMLIRAYEDFLRRETTGASAHHRPLQGIVARALRGADRGRTVRS